MTALLSAFTEQTQRKFGEAYKKLSPRGVRQVKERKRSLNQRYTIGEAAQRNSFEWGETVLCPNIISMRSLSHGKRTTIFPF